MEDDRSPSVFDSNRSISDVPVEKNCRAAWSVSLSSPTRPPVPDLFLRASSATLRGDGAGSICYLAVSCASQFRHDGHCFRRMG